MDSTNDLRFAKSRINPKGGFDAEYNALKVHQIEPAEPKPARTDLRYRVSARLLGRLERLAKARFEIRKLTGQDIESWRHLSPEPYTELAQSVNASSEIENEHVHAQELSLVLAAVTEHKDNVVTDELSDRGKAVKSIIEAYLWALTLDRRSFIDLDLVLEIHSRMFVTTKPQIAGRTKAIEVAIRGGGYDVMTLSPTKTIVFLKSICERTNERLENAVRFAEEPLLLIVAEFILDFLAIHPFEDGNGRTARLLSTYLLERCGYHFARFYPLDNVILESRSEYYEALYRAQKDWFGPSEDLTPWVDFYIDAIHSQFLRAYQRVIDKYQRESIE
ncbi:MAG: Fic family protein [Methylococcales bacterium]